MARLSGLLDREFLLDITLSAEGRIIKAHAVVLASVSKYFEVRQYAVLSSYMSNKYICRRTAAVLHIVLAHLTDN